jgi:hypothetical protein
MVRLIDLDIWRRKPNVSRYGYLYEPRSNTICEQHQILKAFEILETRLEKLKTAQTEILMREL